MFFLLVALGFGLAIYKGMFAEDLVAFVFWVVIAIAAGVTLGQMYQGTIHA